jgi:hypothetical protein
MEPNIWLLTGFSNPNGVGEPKLGACGALEPRVEPAPNVELGNTAAPSFDGAPKETTGPVFPNKELDDGLEGDTETLLGIAGAPKAAAPKGEGPTTSGMVQELVLFSPFVPAAAVAALPAGETPEANSS